VTPFDLVVTYTDGTTDKTHKTPAIWQTNQKSASVAVTTKKPVRSIEVATGIWVDADPSNNTWQKP
jgi:hypothetical protein